MTWLLLTAALAATGFRGDGTGVFEADPPITWGPGEHVAWKTPLPSRSNASPVIVGDLIVVTAEPHSLIGVDRATGEIRWSHEHPASSTLDDAEVRARAEAAHARIAVLTEEIVVAQRLVSSLRRDARRATLTDDLSEKLAAATTTVNDLRREQQELTRRYPYIGEEALPSKVDDFVGLSSSTPVTDGQRIYAVFGNGVVAAHGLDGTLLWSTWVGPPAEDMLGYYNGHAASPLLAEDTLVVGLGELQGLDVATGAVRWRAGNYRDFGTPALFRYGGRAAIATAEGRIVRVHDGALIDTVDASIWYVGPTATDRLVWIGNRDGVTAKATAVDFDLRPQWTASLPSERYYGAPTRMGDRFHLISRFGHILGLSAKDGSVVARHSLPVSAPEEVYSSPTVAGNRLYLSTDTGRTLVLEVGADGYRQLALNELEPFRSSIVFEDDAAYIRGFTHLWCLRAP